MLPSLSLICLRYCCRTESSWLGWLTVCSCRYCFSKLLRVYEENNKLYQRGKKLNYEQLQSFHSNSEFNVHDVE